MNTRDLKDLGAIEANLEQLSAGQGEGFAAILDEEPKFAGACWVVSHANMNRLRLKVEGLDGEKIAVPSMIDNALDVVDAILDRATNAVPPSVTVRTAGGRELHNCIAVSKVVIKREIARAIVGHKIALGTVRSQASVIPGNFGTQQGWQCPVCRRVMSPFMPYCPCAGEGAAHETVTNTGTRPEPARPVVEPPKASAVGKSVRRRRGGRAGGAG